MSCTAVCVYTCSYIWDEGRVQHVGLQSLEVDVSEDGVLFDLCSPPTLAAQSLLGVLGQELKKEKIKLLLCRVVCLKAAKFILAM